MRRSYYELVYASLHGTGFYERTICECSGRYVSTGTDGWRGTGSLSFYVDFPGIFQNTRSMASG